jgi:spermidine synthase
MCLEMMAFRILPPNFGSSLYVWGSIISVFLLGLTLGYFFGGMAADRRPYLAALGLVILLAGLLVPPIPRFQQPLAEWMLARVPNERWAALLYTLFLFGPSTMLLGTVSPYAVRLSSREVQRVGNVAGRLYALSTAGSIFGTLFTAFYWMDVAGIHAITACTGWALVGLGAVLVAAAGLQSRAASSSGRRVVAVVSLVLLPVGARAQSLGHPQGAEGHPTHLRWVPARCAGTRVPLRLAWAEEGHVVFRQDTMYHHISVQDSGPWRELKFDRSSQSGMLKADPLRSMYAYTDGFHLAAIYRPAMKRVLFIGGGAATGPKQFLAFYPGVQVDVAEIDPAVMTVAERYFDFKPDARTAVSIRDGRRFLMTTRNSYDAIIVDAYYADSIPFHVTTVEFMRLVKRRLEPGGVAIFNIIGSMTGSNSQLVRSEYKTILQAFRSCAVFPILETGEEPHDYSSTEVRNVLLVATEAPLAPAEVRRRAAPIRNPRLPHLHEITAAFDGRSLPTRDVPLLSDDFAPVDRMIPVP